MPQTFDTADVLRLEVQRAAETGETFNDLENPDGDLGGYGWVTTVSSSLMRGVYVADQWRLRYRTAAGVPNWFTSEAVPIAPGDWAAARWDNTSVPNYVRGQVEFLDDEATVVGTSGQTGYLATGTVGQVAATQAPAGAVSARLRIDVYSNTSGGNPAGAADFDFRRAALATADAAADLPSPLPELEHAPYTDILGPTHDIKVTREELNVGTLTATVNDATLDPATGTLIRPGRRTRLLLIAEEDATPEPLFVGRILTAQVSYNLLYPVEQKRARIVLTAADNVSPLSAAKRPEGVAEVDELPYVLEGAGVPWNVNGSGNQVLSAAVVAANDQASALDQVAITRDSVRGYAWVSRRGVLNVWDRDLLPTTVADTLDDTTYNGESFEVGYDLAGCINSVTVTVTEINTDTLDTEQVTYGPFTNPESIAEFGLRSADFTVYGLTAAQVPVYAQAILDSNASPTVRVNSLTLPIDTLDELPRALLDLYDLVTVTNTRAALEQDSRITSVEHSISPDKWLVTLGFAASGAVAPPTTTPAPTGGPAQRPKAPTGLDVDAVVGFVGSQPQVTFTASWDAVTENTDDTELVNLDHYELQTKMGAPASTASWAPVASTGPDELEVTLSGYPVDQEISARVRAVNTKGVGGEWSTPTSTAAVNDDGVPSTPSTPTVSSRLGTITIRWDGLTAGGLGMEDDFDYVEVHQSTTNGFTPTAGDPNTLLDRFDGPGYTVKSVGPTGYGVTWYFRFIAIDTSGNASPYSTQASSEVKPLVDVSNFPDDAMNVLYARTGHFITLTSDNFSSNLITADFIDFGSLNGELITGLQIQTSASSTVGIKLKNTGLEVWGGGVRTFYATSSGNVEMKGTLKSGSDISAVNISADQITSGSISGDLISGGTISGVTISGVNSVGASVVTAQGFGATAKTVISSSGITVTNPSGGTALSVSNTGSVTAAGSVAASGAISGAGITSSDLNGGGNTPAEIGNSGLIKRGTSSARYKHDIADLDLDPATVLQMRPVTFRRNDEGVEGRLYAGFIAEELADLGLETWIYRNPDDQPEGIYYAELSAALVVAFKHLHDRVTALEGAA